MFISGQFDKMIIALSFFNKEITMFRRATSTRTWPEGAESYCWLEIKPDSFVGTSRLCESEDEAIEMQNQCGHGEPQEYKTDKDGRKYRTMSITATLGWIRQTSDPNTVKVLDPA